ncbi:hypothetical protein IT413_02195 [Candidatus Peregrinibacteria bacterium]|nr:hypothetical protein [Candidatus Peregrinibacteria bacterium]
MKERFPTKLKEAFMKIRLGKVEEGIKIMNEVKGLEAKKAIAMAELAYFQHDWAKGLELSCSFLPSTEACHYSNIYDEHFAMIILASYHTDAWDKTEKFLKDLLKGLQKLKKDDQPEQRMFQIKQKLSWIKNKAATMKAYKEKPKPRTKGKSIEEIVKQQEEYKPKLNNKPIEKADYILYFLNLYGKTEDFIKVYENAGEGVDYLNHERAAHEYMALGDIKGAQKTLLICAKNWWPVEHMQVEPVALMTENTLLPALTKDICLKIIKTPKGQTSI